MKAKSIDYPLLVKSVHRAMTAVNYLCTYCLDYRQADYVCDKDKSVLSLALLDKPLFNFYLLFNRPFYDSFLTALTNKKRTVDNYLCLLVFVC